MNQYKLKKSLVNLKVEETVSTKDSLAKKPSFGFPYNPLTMIKIFTKRK